MGYGNDGSTWFASELKAINDQCERVESVTPGFMWDTKDGYEEVYHETLLIM